MKEITVYDREGNGVTVQLPYDDWVIDVTSNGWTAWAHSPDGELGVAEAGKTEAEAIAKLKSRLQDWLNFYNAVGDVTLLEENETNISLSMEDTKY